MPVGDTRAGHRQRLKERFLSGDASAHTDEAILELLLTYAIPQKDVRPLAERLLAGFGDLQQVLSADPGALHAVDGIGEHAAVLLRLTGWIGQNCFVQPPATSSSMGESAQDAPEAVVAPPCEQAPDSTTHAETMAVPREAVRRTAVPAERSDKGTRWRATGPYTANNASKAGLVEETRLALLAYARLHDVTATRRELLDGGLPQRSRATRETIVRVIQDRLVAWRPPAWVCDDLVAGAEAPDAPDLRLLLLLHTVRQDHLLYDVLQQVIWPHRQEGLSEISRVDVQRFLDDALPAHPEIDDWSVATREKLAGNLLTILRDYGLLQGAQGSATKHIVEPVVSPWVAAHLARLLAAEGVDAREIPHHDDWRIWLLDAPRAQALLTAAGGEIAR